MATDPVSGESAAKPVTLVHTNLDRDLTDVTVRDGDTGTVSTVKTTAHHPFWDATDNRWVDAGELKPGHRLWVHDDKRLEGDGTGAGSGGGGPGTEVTITRIVNHTGEKIMHDLTIADTHTYYVIAGDTPVLVHNCTSDPILPRKVFRMGENGADDSAQPEIPEGSWQSDGANLTDGEHAFVVLRDGSVRSMPYDQLETYGQWGAGHASLAQEQPVFMGGNFEVTGGQITHYNNGSGHYWPNNVEGYMPVKNVASEALAANGFPGAPDATWRDWRMGQRK